MRTVRIRIRLRDVEPTVQRVVDLPAALPLPALHDVLQAAMGWVDVHLHAFETDAARYAPPDPDGFDDDGLDEGRATLRDLGERWTYLYDFGDGWEHDAQVLGRGGDAPGCVDGTGACPLEDCGGPPGHERLRAVLADPEHPEHAETLGWAGGLLGEFDRAATDLAVRRALGAVPGTVRLVLEVIGDGVALTPGDRLPRRVLHAVQEHRPHWSLSGRPAGLEEDLLPLAVLHDVLRHAGILRVRKGVLAPTRAASDDVEVVRRLRSWFGPDDGFDGCLASVAVAHLLAAGPLDHGELARRSFASLGDRWAIGGRPVGPDDVGRELSRLRHVFLGLDQLADDDRRWSPGPGAWWLLPRAVGMASAWEGATQPHYGGVPGGG